MIDIKDNEVETPDEVARRIENAVKMLGPERVRGVHPDCGSWILSRSAPDRKMQALVQGGTGIVDRQTRAGPKR